MIENKIYIKVIFEIAEKSNKKIDTNNYMSSIQYAKEAIKKADQSEEKLLDFLVKNIDEVISFSVKKLTTLNSTDEKDEDDDWISDDGDEDEVVEELGLSMTFLIYYLIELILIKKGDDSLEKYLKKMRIPNAKKCAKELEDIYKSIYEK
ncbi:hypothetical protein [Flavobacterium sp. 140616W15]|uniref:hypothetical protein n=1 Tax=Flavobacterium sp. 140616W15 TaxID=2478552 RepID=UPI000F0C531E|nr:hypothetical protein [Flavobacterium sp. 140616W15]AYN04415.1 hypothetical protein EAG11_09670 [Flavobacterium sp. 140616W15]